MPKQLVSFIKQHRQPLEEALSEYLPVSSLPGTNRLNEALSYAVFPGGQRLRPILTLLGTVIVDAPVKPIMPAACAVEFLHTSSLILDDLPGMDDADLRRGQTALHLVFGEGIALLTALALLNQAYALLIQAARNTGREKEQNRLIASAAECIGANGMIGGQAVDLESPPALDSSLALRSRNRKTSSLMRFAMSAGAVASGASEGEAGALGCFGECLGAAYQIHDDLRDELGESCVTGKPCGQDCRHERLTFVSELGMEGSHQMVARLIDEGEAAIRTRFSNPAHLRLLSEIVTLMIQRLDGVMSSVCVNL